MDPDPAFRQREGKRHLPSKWRTILLWTDALAYLRFSAWKSKMFPSFEFVHFSGLRHLLNRNKEMRDLYIFLECSSNHSISYIFENFPYENLYITLDFDIFPPKYVFDMVKIWKTLHYYFLLYIYIYEECIGIAKIFDTRFWMDSHVLRYPEHDLTIFRKCLSVSLYQCFQNFMDTVSPEP